jgi:hypothetical protein
MVKKKKARPDWREFDLNTGEYITHRKIQAGATLAHFNAGSLLNTTSFISKVLAVLDKNRNEWLGSSKIRELYNDACKPEIKPINSFRPMMSILYSLGFVERITEGKHTSLYRLKPEIDISERQALFDRAILAKRKERGTG